MSYPTTRAFPPLTAYQLGLSLLLVGLLCWLGTEPEIVFGALTRGWQAVFDLAGLGGMLARLQRATSGQVTTRSLPAVGSYSLLYISCCLLLLRLLLRSSQRTWWAARVYLVLFGLYVLLVAIGKLSGNTHWAYQNGRRIIDFLVSPLPVMFLLPLLWPRPGRSVPQ